MNYFHRHLTHIYIQVIYTAIQNNITPNKHHYLIYYLQKYLRILKFGYTASNIVKTSSLLSCALIPCVTPLSSQPLTTYGHPITILESSIGTIKNTKNGYIGKFLLHTLAHGRATNNTRTHQHASPG